jgi:hypothetical protein
VPYVSYERSLKLAKGKKMKTDFDEVIKKEEIEYGIVRGNENIVFIKSGAGGSYRGYDDKYLKMAITLHERDGSTVVCASNPSDELSIKYDEAILRELINEETKVPVLKFIGVSRGAYLGIVHLSECLRFDKLLLINMPLMLNFHKTTKHLKSKNATFVFGSKDPSSPYVPFLKKHCDDVVVIEGADHNFSDKTEEFIDLVNLI